MQDETVPCSPVSSYLTFPPLLRRSKQQSAHFAASGKARYCRCFSFSHESRLSRGPDLNEQTTMCLPLTQRYISVALFLKSPSAGVTRYPCPVELGLSSCAAFRHMTHAAVCLTRTIYCTTKKALLQEKEKDTPAASNAQILTGGHGSPPLQYIILHQKRILFRNRKPHPF